MKFSSLEIYKLVNRTWELTDIFNNVNILFKPNYGLVRVASFGRAEVGEHLVAEITSDDDFPVEITEDRIVIEGNTLVNSQSGSPYLAGKWELRT